MGGLVRHGHTAWEKRWDDEAGWQDNDGGTVWEVLYGMLVWFGHVGLMVVVVR